MYMKRKTSFAVSRLALASAISSASLFAVPAVAQTADDGADATEDENIIIVTAQRREQDLQKVPAAVTAFSAEQLQGRQISDTNDLQNQIPNVVISTGTGTSSSARIYFRGVGEDESRGAIDPAVGIYIDDVYLGRTVGSLVDLLDIEQVEVLRGPQGTLYGRNTNGGAIKITSVAPQYGETSVAGEVGYGNYDRLHGKATVNLDLGGNGAAARFSGMYKKRDGFFDFNPNDGLADQGINGLGKEEVFAVRAAVRGQMSDRWEAMASIDYTKDKSDPVPSSILPSSDDPTVATDIDGDVFTVEPGQGASCVAAVPQIFQQIGCYTLYDSQVDALGVSIRLKGDYDTFSITSITAFRTLEDELFTHISFPYSQTTDQNQFSQELLVATDFDGPFNFVGGAYYYTEDVDLDTVFFFPTSQNITTESLSFFGQANLEFGGLTLTGGLRYTDETRDFSASSGAPGAATVPFPLVRKVDTSKLTYTGKIGYELTPDVNVYASYSTGFKSPGFSPDCFAAAACFLGVEEEELTTYEIGLRTKFWDNRATFNATYFLNDYSDLQISGTLPNGGFSRANAGEARIQGVELEASFELVDGLNIYAHGSWLDAEYRSLSVFQAGLLTGTNFGTGAPGAACGNVTAAGGSAQFDQQVIDCGLGLQLKNAPEWKGLIGFDYTAAVGDGEMFLGGDAAYESDSFGLVANNPGALIEPGTRLNARIGYRSPGDRYSVTIWGKNLTDRNYWRATTSVNQVYAAPPLTFGIDVGFKFD